MIKVEAVWLSVEPLDMRSGTEGKRGLKALWQSRAELSTIA